MTNIVITNKVSIWFCDEVSPRYMAGLLRKAVQENSLKETLYRTLTSVDSKGNSVYVDSDYSVINDGEWHSKNDGYIYTIDGNEVYVYDVWNEGYLNF